MTPKLKTCSYVTTLDDFLNDVLSDKRVSEGIKSYICCGNLHNEGNERSGVSYSQRA